MMKQMNRQKLKELNPNQICVQKEPAFEHITSAGLSMSEGQTEIV